MNFTLEKTADGLLKSILFGRGRDALKAMYKSKMLATAAPLRGAIPQNMAILADNGAQLLPPTANKLQYAKNVLLGHKPIDVLKQRFLQGGLIGKGGVAHGAVAFTPGTGTPGKIFQGAMNGLTFGLPALTVAHSLHNGDPGGVGRGLGEAAGWAIGYPFGFPSTIIANKIRDAGEHVGKTYFGPKIPEIPNYLTE